MDEKGETSQRSANILSKAWLALRGFGPLALLALLVLFGPALGLWWLRGSTFSLSDLLLAGTISVVCLLGLGLAFGWAVGQLRRGRRK